MGFQERLTPALDAVPGTLAPAPVLIVGLNYAPEEIGIGPYTAGLAEALAERGMQVRVIAGRPYYPRWVPFEGSSRVWRRRNEKGVLVTRSPHYIPSKPSGRNRVLHHASFALSILIPTLLSAIRRRPKLVIAIIPSFLSGPVAWLAARLCGAKLWVHVQDFELEAAFATDLLKRDSLSSRIAEKLERWIYKSADRISSISPQMCAKLKDWGVKRDRVFEFRNWANHADAIMAFETPQQDGYRAEWGIGDKLLALYSGSIGNKQGLELVVEAARELQHREDLTFVICGNGPMRAKLELQALGLPNIQFRDLQPAERVAEMLNTADIHLLPQVENAQDLVLPSKLANILASGKPVVATADEGTGLYGELEGCGILVEPGDVKGFAAGIRLLANDRQLAADIGRIARERARQRWTRDMVISGVSFQIGSLLEAAA